MIALSLRQIAEIAHGELHQCDPDTVVTSNFFFDSRAVIPGGIFIALQGEKVDGARFAESAIAQGAIAVLVDHPLTSPCIVVSDVLESLGLLAHYVRRAIPQLKVVGITGSQGKTTTKDLLTHVLGAAGKTHSARGSYNNDLGAPLTLLECDESVKFCVVEMGARHPGDIARLTKIAEPNIGVVLKVGNAHIGEFGSREKIAETKSELIRFLPPSATAILGTYDEFTPHMADGLGLTTLTFGEDGADVRAADIEWREGRAHFDLVTPAGREPVGLRLVGVHQIANALATAAAATALQLPIEQIAAALSTADNSSKWRMEMSDLDGLLVINDAYNANPESMAAALHTLALLSQERGGRSWAFLGTMHELGERSTQEHQAIGSLAAELSIDHLVAIANTEYSRRMSGETEVHYCANIESAAELFQHFQSGDVILIKASRAEQLERLAESIKVYWRTAHVTQSQEGSE